MQVRFGKRSSDSCVDEGGKRKPSWEATVKIQMTDDRVFSGMYIS